MKQRGRHRRRRRGRALRAALAGAGLALTAAATLISASQATVTDDPGALRPVTSSAELAGLRLTEQPFPRPLTDRLAAATGRPVAVDAVLRSADRTLRTEDACTADERKALPVEPAVTRAYCWDAADTAGRGWRPESVTTSGDAEADGLWGGHRLLLSGWTHRGGADGDLARVAFVNADDPDRLTYTWALLTVPSPGGGLRALASRVSGMAWYGDKLLVTASGADHDALFVYDLHRIYDLRRTAHPTVASAASGAVGRAPGGRSAPGYQSAPGHQSASGHRWASGYRWALPAVAAYRPARGTCAGPARAPGSDAQAGEAAVGPSASGPPCPDGLSVDRSSLPNSLVASETSPRGSGRHTRLWRYAFSTDPARAGLLAADSAGTAAAVEAYDSKADGVRGVLSHRTGPTGRAAWYLGRTAGRPGERGALWRQDLGGAVARACGSFGDARRCWGDGAGSLSYWEGTGELWSLSGQTLFAVPLSALDRGSR
ncbi:hypothetical protein [Streptomyces sp. NPDC046985]|uniref:hypothetical protein n=1 Tax=Streptomyces sp. NPDC046985 TaxID=3155377 RepID=UPI0034064D66